MEDKKNKAKEEENDAPVNILITDLFSPDEITLAGDGTYKTECSDCGLQGARTEGFILFPDTNGSYCHSSHKHFTLLETYALKKKIIRCLDGRDSGDTNAKILGGELFTNTLDEFKNEFGTDKYNRLIEQLNIRKRVEIPGNNRLVSDFCDELGDIYKSRNVLFYRSEAQKVVKIGKYTSINQDGEETVEKGFEEMTGDVFVSLAEIFIHPWTTLFTKNGGEMIVSKSMTQSHANLALASEHFKKKLPIASRIFDIQIPILYKGKLTFPKRGYDKRFGSWLPYNSPQIKIDMFNSVEEAKSLIDKIFEEFCFTSETDRIHAIAGFITPFMRGLLPDFNTRTPVFIYMANRERAGKDYCAGCSGMLYEGVCIEEPPISNDEKGGNSNNNDEFKKKIFACMMQGKKRFHSANNKGLLNNSVFEAVTTSKVWNDRILGSSKTFILKNEMDYSISGNLGIRLTPDLENRSRIINLHLVDEDANARVFNNPMLHEWILKHRISIISALYKLVENWVVKGMLPGNIPFTSFPEWAVVVGGIMEAAGYENPCKKDDVSMLPLDVDTMEMKMLFEECYKRHPNKWTDKRTIRDIVEQENIMPDMDFNLHSDKTKFGLKIDKFVNRMLSGILLKSDLNKRADRRTYLFSKDEIQKFDVKTDEKVEGMVGFGPITVQSPIPIGNNELCLKPPITLPPCQISTIPFKDTVGIKELKTWDDFGKKEAEYLKKEAESMAPKPREKTDRELQFWEAPECAGIVEQCSKDQVLEWVRNNPKVSYVTMDDTLGLGCFKHIGTLIDEGFIKPADDGWEII